MGKEGEGKKKMQMGHGQKRIRADEHRQEKAVGCCSSATTYDKTKYPEKNVRMIFTCFFLNSSTTCKKNKIIS